MKTNVIILLIVVLTSCFSGKHQQQQNAILDLIQDVDSLQEKLTKNKLDSVVEYRLASASLMIRIRSNYNPNKVDMVFGRKVDEFKELQMLFTKEKEENKKTLSGQYALISKSLKEERKTLLLLKSDVDNRKGNKKKYEEYINFEKRKVNTIEGMLENFLLRKKKYLPRFQKTMKEIDEFMDQWEKEHPKAHKLNP